jgi:hypothetical protein
MLWRVPDPVVAAAAGYWITVWSAREANGRAVIEGRRLPSTHD